MNEKLKKLRQKLTERQAQFVELIRSGQDRGNAYINAGYKARTREQAQINASHLLTNNYKVIEYFECLRDEDDRKFNISRAMQLNRLDVLYNMAVEQKNVSAGASVIREQNEMLGFHREQAPNLEKEQVKKELVEQERKELERLAEARMGELSQAGPKVVKLTPA